MLDLKSFVDFCAKHNLTANQVLFCLLVYEKKYELIYKYVNEVAPFTDEERLDLSKRGFIMNANKGGDTYADFYVITEKFLKEISIDTGLATQELWDLFPAFFVSNGRKFPGRTIGPEDLHPIYTRKLKGSTAKHKKIMVALQEQIEANDIGVGIKKWVEGEFWKSETSKSMINDI